MMKAPLKATLVVCLLAALAAAQVSDERRGAPGLEVAGFEWKYEGYAPVEVVRSSKSGVSLGVKRGTDYVFKYDARLRVRNSGARAVRSVEWAHVFYEEETGRDLKRYRLQLRRRVGPGEALTLGKAVYIRPDESTRHLTSGRQRVEVTRVEFEDGGVWKSAEGGGRKP